MQSQLCIDATTIRKLAELARLSLTDAEAERFAGQLGAILGYIEKLSALDTSQVEPLTHPLEIEAPLRPDEPRQRHGESMVEGAPEPLHGNFKVPLVIGGGQ